MQSSWQDIIWTIDSKFTELYVCVNGLNDFKDGA